MNVTESALTPAQPDWKRIKERYIAGEPSAVIAATEGVNVATLRMRAWRNRWRAEMEPAEEPETTNIQDIVKEWILNVALSLLASSRWWASEDLRPKTLRDARDLEAARQAHIASGRALFNLDKSDSDPNRVGWAKAGQEVKVIDVNPINPQVPTPLKVPKK